MPRGLSLIELVVVLAVLGVLAALVLGAVQRVRATAARAACGNNVRQLALAVQQYDAAHGALPQGCGYPYTRPLVGYDRQAGLSWHTAVLPYLEQDALWAEADAAFRANPLGDDFVTHGRVGWHVVRVFLCPTEHRERMAHMEYGLTSYRGVAGTGVPRNDGVMHPGLRVRLPDVTDGTSNTVMIGEQPPGRDGQSGSWYGNWGATCCWAAQVFPAGILARAVYGSGCDLATPSLAAGSPDDDCSSNHFWSLHPGGATFAFCDGSVRFLRYSAAAVLPDLATRAGGEAVAAPD
ncbi:MAG: DUF1559 domain-containing protein [Gemmataceae bacterium]